MHLSRSDRSNLILTVAELIKEAQVAPSGRLMLHDWVKIAHSLKEQIGPELDSKISEICGDSGLFEFVRHSLNRETMQLDRRAKRENLVSIKGYEDPIRVAERLVNNLQLLPHKLRVMSPLPSAMSIAFLHDIKDLKLGNLARLVRGDILREITELMTKNDNLDSLVIKLTDINQYPLNENFHFFVTWHSGFAGGFSGNNCIIEHLDRLRAFLGALVSLKVIEEGFMEELVDYSGVLVHDVTRERSGPLVLTSLTDSDISSFYELHELNLMFGFRNTVIETDDEGTETLTTHHEQLKDRNRILSDIDIIFTANEHSRRIFTSCLWLFRSLASSRAMDSLLYSTISIEVLLGDREMADRVGLTKLLSNRCAYLLGTTRKEREQIMADFKHIYDIRSQIVHTGLHNLDREALKASVAAKSLASKVIFREIILNR